MEVKKRLANLADEKYRAFHAKLTPGAVDILGVRIPDLRKLAKEICQKDARSFLNSPISNQYEELTLYGLVVALAKFPTEEKLRYLKIFVPKINNWATCDVVCSSFKLRQPELAKYWQFIRQYQTSQSEYELRFMFVMMMDYFLTKEYLAEIFRILNQTTSNQYYVNMAMAWLIAEAYVTFPHQIESFLQANQLNAFTQNKAIQKIRESYRISAEDKARLATLKKKA